MTQLHLLPEFIKSKIRSFMFCLIVLIGFFVFLNFSKNTRSNILQDKKSHLYGGTLVWGVATEPTIINPILTTHSISMSLQDLIFNRLVRINGKGEIEPDLAKEWNVSEDGLVYTFYIREGVKFHDGVECTAKDVEFTYRQIIDPKNNSSFRSHFSLAKEFKAVSRYVFQIVLSEPFPGLLTKLIREIAPKHILEGEDLYETSFNYYPVGTGPFKIDKWDRKTNQIELVSNHDYYEGRSYLDRVIIRTYSDFSKLWVALMRHKVDLVQFINSEDYKVVESDPTFKAYKVVGDLYFTIVYKLQDSILRDRKIREAIAQGIDIAEIINASYGSNPPPWKDLSQAWTPALSKSSRTISFSSSNSFTLSLIPISESCWRIT